MKLNTRDGSLDLPESPKQAARFMADLFYNSGRVVDEDVRVSWEDMYKNISPKLKDATTAPDIRPLLQSSLEILIREPVEPLMVITSLFNRVEAKGLNTQVLAGALGAVSAEDIPEHGTYPEVMFQIGGAMQTAYIGKSGLAASFTDEALLYSTWDIMALNMRQMGAALVRHKEQKAVSFLKSLGTELYNNAAPSTSLFGVTTGRGLDMAANGSCTMDDLFQAMAHMAEEGFQPDTILINPLFFYLFVQDPVMRTMMLAHGGGDWFTPFSGQPGPLDPWSNGGMGARGPSLGNRIARGSSSPGGGTATGIAGREHGMTAAAPIPTSYFPWRMQVVVSPFVPFDPETLLGDIYLLSSGNVGFYLVDEDPVTVEWRDEHVDVVKMKIRERYGFAVSHEGQGVGVLKNVKLVRNYFDGVVHAHTLDVDSEIAPDAVIDL
jgi:hypothetical protein